MQLNYIIITNGSDAAVTLDKNIIITADGDFEAINGVSDNLQEIFGEPKEIEFKAQEDWNWDEVIEQLGDALVEDIRASESLREERVFWGRSFR